MRRRLSVCGDDIVGCGDRAHLEIIIEKSFHPKVLRMLALVCRRNYTILKDLRQRWKVSLWLWLVLQFVVEGAASLDDGPNNLSCPHRNHLEKKQGG